MKKLTFLFVFTLVYAGVSSAQGLNRGYKNTYFNIGAEASRMNVEQDASLSQPGFKDKGDFYGGFISFKAYNPLKGVLEAENAFFSFDFKFMKSTNVKRTFSSTLGSYSNVGIIEPGDCSGGTCTPHDTLATYSPDERTDRDQDLWQITLRGGQRFFLTENISTEFYFGVGYQLYRDISSSDVPGYGSAYTTAWHAPLGFNFYTGADGWEFKFNGEFTILPWTQNRLNSYYFFTTDSGGNGLLYKASDIENRSWGYGFLLAAELRKEFGFSGISISPYYRFQSIDSYNNTTVEYDDVKYSGVKRYVGGQDTSEYGLRVSIFF
ncbi:hypothetical protein Dip510_000444 [Elusimicrobium posterum]|uniref:hypothetical protein n=1 Tax=Elusimicrobium posterum TaxID=3116653 RepID=UPI003C793E22